MTPVCASWVCAGATHHRRAARLPAPCRARGAARRLVSACHAVGCGGRTAQRLHRPRPASAASSVDQPRPRSRPPPPTSRIRATTSAAGTPVHPAAARASRSSSRSSSSATGRNAASPAPPPAWRPPAAATCPAGSQGSRASRGCPQASPSSARRLHHGPFGERAALGPQLRDAFRVTALFALPSTSPRERGRPLRRSGSSVPGALHDWPRSWKPRDAVRALVVDSLDERVLLLRFENPVWPRGLRWRPGAEGSSRGEPDCCAARPRELAEERGFPWRSRGPVVVDARARLPRPGPSSSASTSAST